jgi:hypothetical protein
MSDFIDYSKTKKARIIPASDEEIPKYDYVPDDQSNEFQEPVRQLPEQ